MIGTRNTDAIARDLAANFMTDSNGEKPVSRKAEIKPLEIIDGYTLLMTDYPPPVFLFDGLLHNGLTLLAGRPKIGKSWLALQLAVDAAMGRPGLGKFAHRKPTSVLYMALEEGPARTNNRMQKFLSRGAEEAKRSGYLGFGYSMLPLLGGGVEQLDATLAARHCGLVVIDTLIRATGGRTRDKNADAMQEDYRIVEALQSLALKHQTAILVVAHTRKMGADYALDKVAGTTGLTAGADAVWVLDRGPNSIMLSIQGRDMGDAEFALRFEQEDDCYFGWTVTGNGPETRASEEQRAILEVLRESGSPMKPSEIAKELGKKSGSIRRLLMKMRANSLVSLEGGTYRIPS